jgi:hypothetical protein
VQDHINLSPKGPIYLEPLILEDSFDGSIFPARSHLGVQDGLTGESKEISYTQCKIVGNGSFGVVFQTKMSVCLIEIQIKYILPPMRNVGNNPGRFCDIAGNRY